MHPALTEGRAAVITGGASGIGLAAAKRFASLGMKICLADLSQDALDRAEAEMPGATVVTVPTDVSKMDEVLRLKERAYAAFGGVCPPRPSGRYRGFCCHRYRADGCAAECGRAGRPGSASVDIARYRPPERS
jgi:NAD(P)-dependent dehydrogenase (short-subunit alcohol dehydrogenase family)